MITKTKKPTRQGERLRNSKMRSIHARNKRAELYEQITNAISRDLRREERKSEVALVFLQSDEFRGGTDAHELPDSRQIDARSNEGTGLYYSVVYHSWDDNLRGVLAGLGLNRRMTLELHLWIQQNDFPAIYFSDGEFLTYDNLDGNHVEM